MESRTEKAGVLPGKRQRGTEQAPPPWAGRREPLARGRDGRTRRRPAGLGRGGWGVGAGGVGAGGRPNVTGPQTRARQH